MATTTPLRPQILTPLESVFVVSTIWLETSGSGWLIGTMKIIIATAPKIIQKDQIRGNYVSSAVVRGATVNTSRDVPIVTIATQTSGAILLDFGV